MSKRGKSLDSDSIFYSPESSVEQSNVKHIFSKYDYELFDEEKNVPEKVLRIKRICNAQKTAEKWKVLDNNKEIFTLNGIYFNKKQKEFLRTPEGFQFLIGLFKIKIPTIKEVKQGLDGKLQKG